MFKTISILHALLFISTGLSNVDASIDKQNMNPVRSLVSEECRTDTTAILEDPTISAKVDLFTNSLLFDSDFCEIEADDKTIGGACDFGSVDLSEFEDMCESLSGQVLRFSVDLDAKIEFLGVTIVYKIKNAFTCVGATCSTDVVKEMFAGEISEALSLPTGVLDNIPIDIIFDSATSDSPTSGANGLQVSFALFTLVLFFITLLK
mmetsp:Transcript_289/g.438  ORF Transcript_289/g.438 Transcript_289/m.438 type:complete len:206 (-) Transcript_289:382-999(-)